MAKCQGDKDKVFSYKVFLLWPQLGRQKRDKKLGTIKSNRWQEEQEPPGRREGVRKVGGWAGARAGVRSWMQGGPQGAEEQRKTISTSLSTMTASHGWPQGASLQSGCRIPLPLPTPGSCEAYSDRLLSVAGSFVGPPLTHSPLSGGEGLGCGEIKHAVPIPRDPRREQKLTVEKPAHPPPCL